MAGSFRYDLIPSGTRVLCALSGGADSMYLAAKLAEGGIPFSCAHYNHRLRPTAERDEAFVRTWCEAHGIPLVVGSGDVAARVRETGESVEACARTLRYAFLQQAAEHEGCALIATGHHAGDNAETVLMNLIRGAGAGGLGGIPPVRGNIIRPMLAVSREEILSTLTAMGIPHVEDETNADESYTRNKLRHCVLPLLEGVNPKAEAHINAAAARLREDDEFLTALARSVAEQAVWEEESLTLPAAALAEAPRPVALRACSQLARQAGMGPYAVHLEQMLALCRHPDPSAAISIPGGTVHRAYGLLLLTPGQPTPPPAPADLEAFTRWGRWVVTCEEGICPPKAYVNKNEFYLRPAAYSLRSRREGDGVKLGKRPRKSVKKLMTEERVPAHKRETIPVLDHGGAAAAVGGFGPDAGFLAEPGTPALHIIMYTEENDL